MTFSNLDVDIFRSEKKMFKHSAIHFLSIYSMAAIAAILYMRIAYMGFLSTIAFWGNNTHNNNKCNNSTKKKIILIISK